MRHDATLVRSLADRGMQALINLHGDSSDADGPSVNDRSQCTAHRLAHRPHVTRAAVAAMQPLC
jgi:hypothetical protein